MNKFKLLLLTLVIAITYSSCTSEDTNIEQNDEFNIEEAYRKVINSEEPKTAFENYKDSEKAELWKFKYELFISLSKLSDEQIEIINELKNIAVNSLQDNISSDEELLYIHNEVMSNFTEDQFFDLFYFLDNPSLDENLEKQNCFWCTMISDVGDCELVALPQGGYMLAREATFYDCIFWSCGDGSPGYVGCSPEDYINGN